MHKDDGYIYPEKDYEQIKAPFSFRYSKWCRSFEKRARAVQRLFTHPMARISERVVENPLAIAAMSKLKKGSLIVDLGGASSLLGLNLVYLEYKVQVMDLRPHPLHHPDLISKQTDFFNNNLSDSQFDAICCISVIEHVGLDRYGGKSQKDADFKMADEIKRICKPNGIVVISGPYGMGHDPVTDGKPNGFRVYNKTRLDRLIAGFEVESLRFFVMTNGCWTEQQQEIADGVPTARPVEGIFFADLRVIK